MKVGDCQRRCCGRPRETPHEEGVKLIAYAEGHHPDDGADAGHAVDGIFLIFIVAALQVYSHDEIENTCYNERPLIDALFHIVFCRW